MKRLTNVTQLSREEWLKERQKGIGGSDAGSVCGVSPWKTALEVYHEKTGSLEGTDLGEIAEWGLKLEDVIAEEYTNRTGNKVRRNNFILCSEDHPFMIADLDREIVGTDESGRRGGLEIKTSNAFLAKEWGEEGTDEIPETYLMQVQHYMAVTGYDYFDVATLIGGNKMKIYHVERNEELIKSMIYIESNFWDRVVDRTPPDPDYDHKTTMALLNRLYPGTNGETFYLSDNDFHWHKVQAEASEKIKEYSKVVEVAKAHLKEIIGESSVAILPDGTGYTRKKIKCKGYTVSDTECIDFRFTKKPKPTEKKAA